MHQGSCCGGIKKKLAAGATLKGTAFWGAAPAAVQNQVRVVPKDVRFASTATCGAREAAFRTGLMNVFRVIYMAKVAMDRNTATLTTRYISVIFMGTLPYREDPADRPTVLALVRFCFHRYPTHIGYIRLPVLAIYYINPRS